MRVDAKPPVQAASPWPTNNADVVLHPQKSDISPLVLVALYDCCV